METTQIPEEIEGRTLDTEQCIAAMVPVTEVMGQIGGKWTIHIITLLSAGPMRFSELKRSIGSISQKVLTSTLRDLEKDGFVSRKVTPSIPPRVDYALTEMGKEVREPLRMITRWAHLNRERVQAAREAFSARVEAERRLAW
jgi:DNA-binding HxlR family transcriptional regulator